MTVEGSAGGEETSATPAYCAASGEGGDGDPPEAELDETDDPMNPAAWYAEPNVCGSCIAWRPEDPRAGEDVAAGSCKLRPELPRVPATLKKCNLYKQRGYRYEPGRAAPTRRRKSGAVKVLRRSAEGEMVPSRPEPSSARLQVIREWEVLQRPEDDEVVEESGEVRAPGEARPERPTLPVPKDINLGPEANVPGLKQSILELVRQELGRSRRDMHSKYRGGALIAESGDGKRVRVPVERFFAVLNKVRSSLDALEAQVDKSPGLADVREELVTSIRRAHGSFTTFNLLFQDREDYFSGKE